MTGSPVTRLGTPRCSESALSQAMKPSGTHKVPPLTSHRTSTCLSEQMDPRAALPCRSHTLFVTRMGKSTSNGWPLHPPPLRPQVGQAEGWVKPFLPCPGERAPWISTHGCPCSTLQPGERAKTEKHKGTPPRPPCIGDRDSKGGLYHCRHALGAPGARAQLHQDAAPAWEVAGSRQQVRGKMPARSLLPGPAAPGLSPT